MANSNTSTKVAFASAARQVKKINSISQLQSEVTVLRKHLFKVTKEVEVIKSQHEEEIAALKKQIVNLSNELKSEKSRHNAVVSNTVKQKVSYRRNVSNQETSRLVQKKTYASVLIHTQGNKNPIDIIKEVQPEPKEIGLKKWSKFSNSTAILSFENQDQLCKFKQNVSNLGIAVKSVVKKPYEFRVHRIPLDSTEDELRLRLCDLTATDRISVKFIKYKSITDSILGLVSCNEQAFNRMKNVKLITFRWARCPIDIKPILMVCKLCGLLGHTKNHCAGQIVIPDNTDGPCCLNCYEHNRKCQANGRPKSHWRTTNHEIADSKCPTRRAYRRKYIRARKANSIDEDDVRNNSTSTVVSPMRETSTPDARIDVSQVTNISAENAEINVNVQHSPVVAKRKAEAGNSSLNLSITSQSTAAVNEEDNTSLDDNTSSTSLDEEEEDSESESESEFSTTLRKLTNKFVKEMVLGILRRKDINPNTVNL